MSRRWTNFDTDAHRLPSGFTRMGYDSNTRRYHFSDAEGRIYQGEPGEEFGGRLTPMNAVDPSMRHRFAPDDDDGENAVDNFPNSSELGSARPISTPAVQTTRHVPQTASSFSDFLSPNQVVAATSLKPPQKKPSNRGSKFSLKRITASIMAFRSTKSKGKSAALPSLPSPGVDEWGIVQPPHSAKF
ncbi:hypothetical protein BDM02DRAFT_3184294 [Thelephora ganbajun]|uniref:Uncharacterized protein n=1 Tax=Thelephora ganbajun TaxID=370292 RepID=A0ACB6ZQT1_THEGA|nr:hypothetical protein BDM02DRAFT_3184294 [Thelephora ganbajun]